MMQSSGSESASPITHRLQSLSAADTRGKHRIQAELKRLEQEARCLEATKLVTYRAMAILPVKKIMEEIEQLEKMARASAACKEMLSYIENKPDPLLPV
ncbi:hypothetical protein FEM48_Zijuj07G0116300 [Ziziphus jujuba var. spinosa]|uniref:G protein gamma domain-containing protein n=1 Tax=Ziziphus jujuba var. spinosa TaxID=714518 RepID=A0A978V4E7_ZIZJJ|nr:hypothetical protein FEM48_Zijuj07G0116300 [Ziziphus jujuba var. spinosa]